MRGADLLVNLTNDAWFGKTSAPYHHLSMAVMRAVENRRPLLRAANTGFSAVIQPQGKIVAMSDLFKEATEAKKAWISAEAAAGVHEIEVCSFVPAKLIPQFVDAEEVLAHANAVAGLTPVVLVPNFKGCERAIAAGARRR